MRITKKMCIEFLDKIAAKKMSNRPGLEDFEGYYSKVDGSFITSNPESVKWMLKNGITEQIQNVDNIPEHTSNIGYNPVDQKWYGWSHRAFYGFGIGSEVKKGSVGYVAPNEDDFLEYAVEFWTDEYRENISGILVTDDNGNIYAQISWDYSEHTPNKSIRGKLETVRHIAPNKWGKGEWTAETLEDAKQMAIDFARSVS